ncbi:type II toxin-antitoxin system RelE/ParE family toxin [Olivibacter sitiensis]|uniref:type II toxin-antitoxin system RelE/ParE family toxin n=1 Tax=Olivibacter sitiensis TaxID=376470 RepID=UPI000481675B|nr:type II toxin-antitoxin system RelE/ParE family toxin [Olivibacter sitiensis]
MVEVIWTDNAVADLNDIGEYIAKDSERYAELTVSKLFAAADVLEENPRVGSVVSEFRDDKIRQLIIDNYRMVYQVADAEDCVYVLTVHYAKRLVKNTRHFKR